MPRIHDYVSFDNSKGRRVSSEYSFSHELGYLDIDLINRPPELVDVDEKECEIEYSVSIGRSKSGIQDLKFQIDNIELELKVDSYPDPPKEYEMDIVPGENIDMSSVLCKKARNLIPCNPTKVVVDMRKSMNPKDFKIDVLFGENE
jgi:hypothetical protein